jgi:hypothetical protein
MEKTIKQPFTVYDVMAYLAPGLALILGATLVFYLMRGGFSVESKGQFLKIILPTGGSWVAMVTEICSHWYTFAFAFFAMWLITYILGHFVATLSSLLIDSFIIRRIRGYPFSIMLDKKFPLSDHEAKKRRLAKGAHGYFIVAMCLYPIRLLPVWIPNFILIWCGVLVLVRMGSAAADVQEGQGWKATANRLWRIGAFLAWPGVFLFDLCITTTYAVSKTYKPMGTAAQDEFCRACKKTFETACQGVTCPHDSSEIYWRTSAYLLEATDAHAKNINNWLNLYSFCRNICMSFFLLFIMTFVMGRTVFAEVPNNPHFFWFPVIFGSLAAIFLLRYVYLYYKYYSKYIARAFMCHVLQKPKPD